MEYQGYINDPSTEEWDSPKGPFIYYAGLILLKHFTLLSQLFQEFLGIFLLLYVLEISNYCKKIWSKCNVEIEILLF